MIRKENLKYSIVTRNTLRVGPQGRRLGYGHVKKVIKPNINYAK